MGKSKAGRTGEDRSERDKTRSELATLLSEHREEIATAWAEMVQGLPGSSYGSLPPEEVHSLTLRGLGAMVESLETGSHAVLEDYLAEISPAGAATVPDAAAVTETLLLCKDAAVPVI